MVEASTQPPSRDIGRLLYADRDGHVRQPAALNYGQGGAEVADGGESCDRLVAKLRYSGSNSTEVINGQDESSFKEGVMIWGTIRSGFIRKTQGGKCEEVGLLGQRAVAVAASAFLLYLLSVVATVSPALAQGSSGQVLHNEDVIQMVHAKLSDGLIIAKIKSSACKFDTSTSQLIKLKSEGVSDAVLKAMAECGAPAAAPAAAAASPANPNDPTSPHPPGIYWESKSGGHTQMAALEPSSYSRGKMTGGLAMGFTMGISKAKWKVVVNGARARLHIPDSKPEFWFYFATAGGSFSAGPSSPNDFTLVILNKRHSHRELVVGQANITGVSSGVPSKETVSLSTKEVSPGIYEAVPTKPLKPGEYAFLPAGQGSMTLSMTGGKLFDFEIDRGK